MSKFLIVIAGPTAVGKTALAIRLAKLYNTVIVSADSRQFYRQMNIGTAKPDETQLKEAKHFFINTKNVGELYGAGHYAKDVIALLEELFKEHNVVLLAGGSGLYINAVLNGVDDFEEVPQNIRETLNETYKAKGLEWLREELNKHDPAYFKTVDTNNRQRMLRALEVCTYTGKTYSSFLNKEQKERSFTAVPILLNTSRDELYQRINQRVDQMIQSGLPNEVRQLGDYREFNALKTVGYKELFEFIDGHYTLQQAIDKIKQHTRNYAKRQITWFRNKGNFTEFDPEDFEKIKTHINSILTHG